MSELKRSPLGQAPRDTSSAAAKRESRARAEAAGFAMLEREASARREQSERLRKLREARQSRDGKMAAAE